jgi:hypothetical protein
MAKCLRPLLLLAAALAAGPPAAADDRPFLATWRAVAEEDDDNVWEFEAVVDAGRSLRSATLELQYAFDPLRSLQLEAGRVDDRFAGSIAGAVEVSYRQLFNHIDRDGWGIGIALTAELARPLGQGWEGGGWQLTVPLSLRIGEQGPGLLHLNLGLGKPRADPLRWTGSIAGEYEVVRRTVLFAELARGLEQDLRHGGVRYWFTRERFAVDLSLRRSRVDGQGDTGVVFGLGWYDL